MAPHLELAELEQRYRQATDPVARSQWQIIWLLAQGQSTMQVVQNTGYSQPGSARLYSATTSMVRTELAIDVTPIPLRPHSYPPSNSPNLRWSGARWRSVDRSENRQMDG